MKIIPTSVSNYLKFVVSGTSGGNEPLKGNALLKRVAVVMLTLLVISSTVTVAQTTPPPAAAAASPSTTSAMTGADAFAQVGAAINQGLAKVAGSATSGGATGTGTRLASIGWQLFYFFLIANFVWIGLKGMLAGGGLNSFFGDMVPVLVTAGVVGTFMSKDIGGQVVSSIDVIGAAMTGNDVRSLDQLIIGAGSTAFEAISNTFSIPASMLSRFEWYQVIGAIPVILMAIIPVCLTVFFILAAMVIYLGMLVTSQISVTIAFIFAPVLVPFLMFRPASFLFDGWLRFLIGASFMKIIGLLMNQFTGAILDKMAAISVMANKSGSYTAGTGIDGFSVDIVLYGSMILLSGICTMMMLQVPSIALGLISGNAGGAGFSGLGGLAKMSSAKGLIGTGPTAKDRNGSAGAVGRGLNALRGGGSGGGGGGGGGAGPSGPPAPQGGYRAGQAAGRAASRIGSTFQAGVSRGGSTR